MVHHFNGMTNQMHTTAYPVVEDCESHWTYGDIAELPLRSDAAEIADLMRIVKLDLGQEAVLELDQELILALSCPACGTREEVLEPISRVGFNRAHCRCGMQTDQAIPLLNETFLSRTLANIESAFCILRAYNISNYRFYELTGIYTRFIFSF